MSKKDLLFLNPSLFEEYDNFVTEHKMGYLTAFSRWGKVISKISPHLKNYTLLLKRDNRITAALPLYKNEGLFVPSYYISTPFATVNDPLLTNDNDLEEMLSKIDNLRKNKDKIEIRTTFFNNSSIFLKNGFFCRKTYKFHQIELNRSLEDIYHNFHKSKVQKCIKIGEKNSVKVYNSINPKDLTPFYKLYLSTRKKHFLPVLPISFFYALWENYKPTENLYLLIAEFKDNPIGALMLFKYKNRMSAEVLGWNSQFKSYRPSHLLYWEAIKLAVEKGCSVFDFGRTEPDNTSLIEFKRGWGTKEIDTAVYTTSTEDKKHINKDRKSIFARKIFSSLPSFLYKKLSSFFYKHIYTG